MLPVMPAEGDVNERRGSCAAGAPRTVQTRVSERELRGRLHLFEVPAMDVDISIEIARSWKTRAVRVSAEFPELIGAMSRRQVMRRCHRIGPGESRAVSTEATA